MTTEVSSPAEPGSVNDAESPVLAFDDGMPGVGMSEAAERKRRDRLHRRLINNIRSAGISGVLAAIFLTLVVLAANGNTTLIGNQIVSGLELGAVASLSGVGLVMAYRATGVFNFAQAGVATVAAFVYYEFAHGVGTRPLFGMPTWIAGILALVLVGPTLGTAMELAVFRPLQQRAAGTSERLVANLGVLIVLLGITGLIYGLDSYQTNTIFSSANAFSFGQVGVSYSLIGNLVLVVVAGGGLALLLAKTRLGRQIRAVVDRRGLAELNGVRANRVAVIAWSLGCSFAAMAGILYAPQGFQSGALALQILQTIGVAVIAKLRSIGGAVAAGFGLGLAQSLGNILESPHYPSWVPIPGVNRNIVTELPVIATLAFLLIYRTLDEVGAGNAAALVSGSFSRAKRTSRGLSFGLPTAAAAVIVVMALVVGGDNEKTMTSIVCYSVAFLAIVAITGYSGHISLATASFAGIGAYVSTRLSNGYWPLPVSSTIGHVPVLISTLIAGLVCVPLGVLIGFPALRRRGLILGLLTLAFAQVIEALVFEQTSWTNGGTIVHRPHLGPLDLTGDRAFLFFSLAMLALTLLLVRNLRSGSLGRVLGAMRDSENGAVSVGISLRRYKLFIFGVSSFIAGVGGALIEQQKLGTLGFDAGGTFSPLFGLYWFGAVVVFGLSYRTGAILAAITFIGVDKLTQPGASLVAIGLFAALIGFLRGGLIAAALRAREPLRASLAAYVREHRERANRPVPGTGLRPSVYAAALLGIEPARPERLRPAPRRTR